MLYVQIPLLDEEDDGWMLKIEEEYFLNNTMESYDVVSTVIDEILDSVEAHGTFQNILGQLNYQITVWL